MRFPSFSRLLLICLTALLPVSRVIPVGGKLVNFSFADLVLPLALLSLAGRGLSHGMGRGLRLPLAALLLLNLGMLGASAVLNLEYALGYRSGLSLTIDLLKIISLWFYFYAMANLVESKEDFLAALKAWTFSSILIAALGVAGSLAYQKLGLETPFSLQFRAQGTFDDANLFAAHCGLSIFLVLLYRRLTPGQPGWPLLAVPVFLLAILFSASRGSMLAVGLAFATLGFLFSPARVKAGLAFLLLLGVLGLLALPGGSEALAANPVTARLTTTTVDLDNPEARQRRELWEAAIDTWRENPWFGVGRGNYGLGLRGEAGAIGIAHNTYLGLLAETGSLGFMVYAAIVGACVGPVLKAVFSRGQVGSGFLIAGCLVLALAGVTINIENYRGLWVLLGILECYRRVHLGHGEGGHEAVA
jgi:O-antigen ligase